MRAVRSKDTKPELAVRKAIRALGIGYRLHGAHLPGRPDIVFKGRKKVIFVHGCYWHGHDCKRGSRIPKSNTAYWTAKIERNRARDREVSSKLQETGWSTLTLWECQIRDPAILDEALRNFLE